MMLAEREKRDERLSESGKSPYICFANDQAGSTDPCVIPDTLAPEWSFDQFLPEQIQGAPFFL